MSSFPSLRALSLLYFLTIVFVFGSKAVLLLYGRISETAAHRGVYFHSAAACISSVGAPRVVQRYGGASDKDSQAADEGRQADFGEPSPQAGARRAMAACVAAAAACRRRLPPPPGRPKMRTNPPPPTTPHCLLPVAPAGGGPQARAAGVWQPHQPGRQGRRVGPAEAQGGESNLLLLSFGLWKKWGGRGGGG